MYTMRALLALAPFLATTLAGGLDPICQGIGMNTQENSCVRYVQGFDVTGVVTEVDLTFEKNGIDSKCDCIKACLSSPKTCAAWVYKFSTPASVADGHRTCTLYSQFNLPSAVAIEIDLDNGNNKNINAAEITMMNNNPQEGSSVPQAFKDKALNTTPDNDAFSGAVWQLATGKALC